MISHKDLADYARTDYSRADYARADYSRADYSRADYARADYARADFTILNNIFVPLRQICFDIKSAPPNMCINVIKTVIQPTYEYLLLNQHNNLKYSK